MRVYQASNIDKDLFVFLYVNDNNNLHVTLKLLLLGELSDWKIKVGILIVSNAINLVEKLT